MLALFFNKLTRIAHDVLEYTAMYPSLKAAVHRVLGTELARKVFPLGAVVKHPEDAAHRVAFVGTASTTQRVHRRIRNTFANPIKLVISKFKHDGIVYSYHQN